MLGMAGAIFQTDTAEPSPSSPWVTTLWLGAQTVQQHMPVMTFPQRPGLHWWAKAGGKKDSSVHTVTQTPSRLSSLCAESIRNPFFTSLFCSSLSTQAHKMATNITARPITRFWWIQSYSLGTYLACWPDYLFCLSSLFILWVQHNIALLWEFMQIHWAGYDRNYALIYTAVADHFAIRGCGCICFIFASEFTGNFFHFF